MYIKLNRGHGGRILQTIQLKGRLTKHTQNTSSHTTKSIVRNICKLINLKRGYLPLLYRVNRQRNSVNLFVCTRNPSTNLTYNKDTYKTTTLQKYFDIRVISGRDPLRLLVYLLGGLGVNR